jgi:hypothetical protein
MAIDAIHTAHHQALRPRVRSVGSFAAPAPSFPAQVVGAEGLEPWSLSGTPRAIGTPCDKLRL